MPPPLEQAVLKQFGTLFFYVEAEFIFYLLYFSIVLSSVIFQMFILFCCLFFHSDYIQCPYCMRRFNETAASRHINFCKDQASRRVFDPAQTAAKLASRAQVIPLSKC